MGNGAALMRLPPTNSTNMPYTKQSQEFGLVDSSMDKVKKLLQSPGSKRKTNHNGQGPKGATPSPSRTATLPPGKGYFNIPLQDLRKREKKDIPKLVTKICEYIYDNGLDMEGVFRVNGNQRVVEKLRYAFDYHGDADLEEAGDIMAVAGLLKLFLRELPDAIIPESLTGHFVKVQEEHARDKSKCIEGICSLLKELPPNNYKTLKYLCKFLVVVTRSEDENKMSPMALGIVFGPNVFRCTAGIQGLREQGITNHIMLKFITDFDSIFLQPGEISPYSSNFSLVLEGKKRKAPAPPRPPPPRQEGGMDSTPVPSPRKQKLRREILLPGEQDEMETSEKSSSAASRSQGVSTPRMSEDEFLDTYRSSSPLMLESDRSECGTLTANSIAASLAQTEVIEKVISSAITDHLFGDPDPSSDDSQSSYGKHSQPVPAPRRRRRPRDAFDSDTTDEQMDDSPKYSVKQRINQLESDSPPAERRHHDSKPRKQRPNSKAYELFETKGIVIGPAPDKFSKLSGASPPGSDLTNYSDEERDDVSPHGHPVPHPRSPRKRHASPDRQDDKNSEPSPPSVHIPGEGDLSFHSLDKGQTLTAFKRAPGPKNRRGPSRRSLHSQSSTEEDTTTTTGHQSTHPESPDEGPPRPRQFLAEDENHNATTKKANLPFLDNLHNGTGDDQHNSPDKSPLVARKPYVPPLDLTILHEHGDGSDPIPAHHGPSISLHKAKSMPANEAALLSPRMSKLKKKTGEQQTEAPPSPMFASFSSAHHDTDVPPSPPTEQLTLFTKSGKHNDDDNTIQIKQLTKKIQSCKRKIKAFEELFEQEHGYRPSQSDKAARQDIKRCMQELAKSRKELRNVNSAAEMSPLAQKYSHSGSGVFCFDRDIIGSYASPALDPKHVGRNVAMTTVNRVKEELEREKLAEAQMMSEVPMSAVSSGSSTKDTVLDTPSSSNRMEDTLGILLQRLEEKRSDNGRPEDLSVMSRDMVQEEKVAVQKALLHFEGQHGRPTTKAEKELMRPLYDRYRNIKRILAKPQSPREKLQELQSVPEGETIEFATTPSTSKSTDRGPIHVPTGLDGDEDAEDFMVTRDFGLLKQTIRPDESHVQVHVNVSPPCSDSQRNLHELTLSQLFDEQSRAKQDKKRLRKVLREFEDDFLQQTGRKVQKDDRAPMETEYHEYKQVKAKLKLLEALVSKHDPMGVY